MMHDNEQVYDRIVFEAPTITDDYITLSGYANRYLDDAGQVVIDTEYSAILPVAYKFNKLNKNPILLFNHDWNQPIGTITALEQRTDGLYIEAKIVREANPQVFALVKNGIIKMFSVSFVPTQSHYDDQLGAEVVTEACLWEISVVTIPANDESHVQHVNTCDGTSCTVIKSAGTQKMDLRAQVEQIVRKKLEI